MKVGYATYAILWMNDAEWNLSNRNPDWAGVSEHEEHRIIIRVTPERSEDSMRETLLHEIIHACWCSVGLNHFPSLTRPDLDDIEEYVITAQSPILLMVLNDNPDVLAYLLNLGEPG